MKRFLSLLLLLVSVLVMAGCDKDKVTSEYEVKSLAELKEAKNIVVTFKHPFGDTITEALTELKESFEAEYQNITIELVNVSGYDELKKSIIYDINSGEAPTMTVGYADHFAEYMITDSIISLNKFIEAEDAAIGYSDAELADFVAGYLEENRSFDKEGTYYGMPFNKSTEALYYNADFFKEFDLEVPETWAEYEATSAQIYEIVSTLEDGEYSWLGDIATNLENGEFVPGMYDSTSNLFTTIIHQFDGLYTRSYYNESGTINLQSGEISFVDNDKDDKAKEALTYMQTLANNKYITVPEAWEGSYGSNFFVDGKILMNIGSTGGSSYYATSICDWGVSPIPYKDADHKYAIQQGTNFTIFSQATDLEKLAAWMFIKHCLTPENTTQFAIATGYMPVRLSAYDSQEYKDFLDPETRTPAQIATSKVHNGVKAYSDGTWNYFVDAAWSGSGKVREEVGTAVVDILVRKMNVAKAFADAKNRIG
jgi:multiple sugar transport system substrate-binding protein